MDYLQIYNKLIQSGNDPNRQSLKELHKHRIVPGFLGGEYIKENITFLSRKEHRIVHKICFKLFGFWQDLSAYKLLGGKNSEPWNKGKKGYQVAWNKGMQMPYKGLTWEEIYGVEKSKEMKLQKSDFFKCNNPLKDGKIREKHKQSIKTWFENNESSNKNKTKTKEHRRKISEKLLGYKRTLESRKKQGKSLEGNQHTKGMCWYNDGLKTKLFFPSSVPDGWLKGRKNA